MTWIDDIGTFLQSNGIGTLATDIFYDVLDSTDNCIALIETPWLKAEVSLSNDMRLEKSGLEILVRNLDDATANQKAISVYELLKLKVNTVIGSTIFKRIEAVSRPYLLSQTETDLFIYTVNFEVQVTT